MKTDAPCYEFALENRCAPDVLNTWITDEAFQAHSCRVCRPISVEARLLGCRFDRLSQIGDNC